MYAAPDPANEPVVILDDDEDPGEPTNGEAGAFLEGEGHAPFGTLGGEKWVPDSLAHQTLPYIPFKDNADGGPSINGSLLNVSVVFEGTLGAPFGKSL